ncbi:MAG: diphosphomevalonate decarboxylase [Halobacteriovoraceae bacterium]|jgi:diphosphomevalonate decarboxylase|nr:diphosphomevalonate decarboxylase [Halobacteriovoraceae bacterium]
MSILPTNTVLVKAPSNIAFVKYWGKHGRQLPTNPSISMTLSKCVTHMKLSYEHKDNGRAVKSFHFEGEENLKFKQRIEKFLKSIEDIFPLASCLNLQIESRNTFPHSAGIASSASAMAALSAGLVEIEKQVLLSHDYSLERASMLARLASGSACRSFYPQYALWGKSQFGIGSDQHAMPIENIHINFKNICDSILIVSGETKEVSSSAGHDLMTSHLYKNVRVEQAHQNLQLILKSIQEGRYEDFGVILENEALTLHALMMTSYPSFMLLKPNSLILIDQIKILRKKHSIPMYFTIDAGPNIHLIYPHSFLPKVLKLIESEMKPYCEMVIHDQIGDGVSVQNG